YDPAGNKTSYTDPDGNVTTYAYDTAEQLITQTAPGGLVTRYAYDGAGRVGVLTKPDGTTITSAYDADGRLLSATPTTGTPASYTYDSLGHRATMTDETGTTSYHYNANGQPTSVTNGANQTVTYGYDNAGRNTTLGYPGSKTVTYTYDADARMTSLTDWSNHKTTFSWTADSQLSKQTDPNKIVSTTSYNKNDLITGINLVNSTAPTISIASYAYGYDAGSQLTSTTIADPLHTTSGGATTTYGYDLRGQITTVSTGGSYVSTPAGFLADTPNGSVRTSNAAQQLESAANPTSASGTSYSYDANGNRSAQTHTLNGDPTSSTSFTYDWSSNLTSAGSVTYTADSDRLRETRTDSNGTKQWLWNTASDQPELLSDGIHQYLYGPSLTPVAQIDSNGTIQYLHGDNIGSVRLVTNASGSITSIADYDAYGDSTWSGAPASFGFAGEWADPATGFIYLRARDYDPATEQFLQVDPAINQTHQPYAYAANSPLASVDPTGLCVGIDGTPQDRICTWNDYFWDSLGPNILAQFKIANAGFSAGSTFGVGLLTNNDEACYGGNAEFWVEYGLGALVSAAGILATGGGSLEALGARGGAGVIEDEVAGADVGTASMSNAADGGMAGVRATGRAGEEMSGIVKNTDRIPSM
ncbi:RHS repeat-associated core domain-containing protein, partial [Mesorhizobium japonicum]|uniref:RHS repeat-associated core domain-containing protein n=1 Tax=Mesorhizobium japonicum TaxID=2066070 RepID=UPI003B5BF034